VVLYTMNASMLGVAKDLAESFNGLVQKFKPALDLLAQMSPSAALASEALGLMDTATTKLDATIAENTKKAQEWSTKYLQAIEPLQKTATQAAAAAEEVKKLPAAAEESAKGVIKIYEGSGADKTIAKSLTGGFGKGAAEGGKKVREEVRTLREYAATHPIEVKLKVDTEEIDRYFDRQGANTGGSLP